VTGKGPIYRFADVEVEPAAQRAERGGQALALEPKAYAVLVALLEDAGVVLGRDELLDRVWGHRHVTPGVLNRVIAQLRKALGDDAEHPRYIQTLHSRGYRFIADVARSECQPVATPPPAAPGAAPLEASPATAIPVTSNAPATVAPRPYPHDDGGHHGSSHAVFHRWRWLALAASLAALGLLLWNRPPGSTPGVARASVAVLPFTSLGGDQDDRAFAEGLAIEMHDALAGVEGLRVAALLSPQAPGAWRDARTVGERLGVATVLDASVRRDGRDLRISAHLSDTRTGYVLWSHVYDRQAGDVFATQGEIAGEVVRALLGRTAGADGALARRLAPTASVAAFDSYLTGLQALWRADDEEDYARAEQAFGRALAVDAGFARAQAGVCRAETARFVNQRDPAAYARAGIACARAQQMDPGASEIALAQAELHEAHGDNASAVADYARAELDPARRPAVYVGMAMLRAGEGREDLAREYFRRALALRPRDPAIQSWYGYHLYQAGDLRGAIAAYRKAVELAPGNAGYWNMLGMMHINAGDNAAGERALEKSLALEPNYAALSNLGELRYQAGDYAAAATLHRRAAALAPADYLPWANLGDALLADPATAGQAPGAFRVAAARARAYLETRPGDATAVAALAWYEANLGHAEQARALARRADTGGAHTDPAEAALYLAETFAVLGDAAQARARIAAALDAGMPRTRIDTNAVLRRAGLVPGDGASSPASATQAAGAHEER
jgi:DNA-binding winged helix-turn-helix (wHTH) protein/TolB-like protein/Flp pilus assembly protein TadD